MKRKREDFTSGASGKGGTTAAPSGRIDAKVHHGIKQVTRALKLAKGFERQKLGRRQKAALASEDSNQISRINAEIEALKNIDVGAASELQVIKTLSRVKSITQSCELPVRSRPNLPSSLAAVNVIARLYNTKPVKDAVDEVVVNIKSLLGVSEPHLVPSIMKQTGGKASKHLSPNSNENRHKTDKALSNTLKNNSEDDDSKSIGQVDNASSIEDETRLIDNRLDYRVDRDNSNGDISVSAPMGPQKGLSKAQPYDYSFLPSLTAGGYASGSESATDEEVYNHRAKPRKNRRGQRARQAIWEKKYGRKARHLQHESDLRQGKEPSRDAGWDPKRGAQVELRGKRGYAPGWVRARMASKQGPTGGNSTVLGTRHGPQTHDTQPLHPSWAAKAMAKQRDAKAYEGQKLVFD